MTLRETHPSAKKPARGQLFSAHEGRSLILYQKNTLSKNSVAFQINELRTKMVLITHRYGAKLYTIPLKWSINPSAYASFSKTGHANIGFPQ